MALTPIPTRTPWTVSVTRHNPPLDFITHFALESEALLFADIVKNAFPTAEVVIIGPAGSFIFNPDP
jgi:hypothetical protein